MSAPDHAALAAEWRKAVRAYNDAPQTADALDVAGANLWAAGDHLLAALLAAPEPWVISPPRVGNSASQTNAAPEPRSLSLDTVSDADVIQMARHIASLVNDTMGWTSKIAAAIRSAVRTAERRAAPEPSDEAVAREFDSTRLLSYHHETDLEWKARVVREVRAAEQRARGK